jgi:glycosyltransferase involved in cell wall biosynthesis
VMCLTNQDHTMQRGACEALCLGKPIITSDWPVLREYFSQGTLHVDNSAEGIYQAICRMKENLPAFQEGIQALRIAQRQEWQDKISRLVHLIQHAVPRT